MARARLGGARRIDAASPPVGTLRWGVAPDLDPARVGRRRWIGQLVVASMVPAMMTAGVATRAAAEVAPAAAPASAGVVSQAGSARPNIVMILTDDQRRDDLGVMPNVETELAGHGTTFTNGIVVNAVCCPSRATVLTGRQSHSSGVFTNGSDCHGARPFDDRSTIATTLAGVGYRTGLVGKYMNSWVGPAAPPGWSDWHAFSGFYDNTGGAYYDYQLSNNGALQTYGSAATDYSTDVLAGYASGFIRATPATQPLFLMFTPFGPHGGQKPAPRDLGKFSSMVIPHGPDFNEADVSDKPAYVQQTARPDGSRREEPRQRAPHARETLLSVDAAVGGIVQALQDTNRLANTLIVFASDQGLDRGEHRIDNKGAPYEDIINIPLVARFDAVGSTARTESRLASNIDFAPTFAALAGTSMPGADGRNLLPLLTGEPVPWRSDVLTEYVKDAASTPSYCAIRTSDGGVRGLCDGRGRALRPHPRPLRDQQPCPATRPAPRRWPGSRASQLRPAASRPGHHRPPWGPRLASYRSRPTGCSTPAHPARSGSRSPTRVRRCRSASSATARPRHPWARLPSP